MATASEVKAGLDDIAQEIRTERNRCKSAQSQIALAQAQLNALPTKYGGVIATIQAFAGVDEFETQALAELSRLTTEFQALKAKALTGKTGMDAIDFAT